MLENYCDSVDSIVNTPEPHQERSPDAKYLLNVCRLFEELYITEVVATEEDTMVEELIQELSEKQ